GLRPEMMKVGDEITIRIAPMRDGSDGGYVTALLTADGTAIGNITRADWSVAGGAGRGPLGRRGALRRRTLRRRPLPALRLQQPVRAARLVGVEPLAVVAAHALRQHDLPLPDRAPLARLLAERALAARGPALDLEHGQRR